MKGNPKVIEYLNKGLTSELTAVNQYWLHYRLLDDWGFTRLAKKEREESIEEMHHADKLITRIIFLEGFPNLQHIDPLMIGQNIKEVLECDLKAEYGARALYMEARACCRKEEDYVSMDLFEELLAGKQHGIDGNHFIHVAMHEQDRRPIAFPAGKFLGIGKRAGIADDRRRRRAAGEADGKRDHRTLAEAHEAERARGEPQALKLGGEESIEDGARLLHAPHHLAGIA